MSKSIKVLVFSAMCIALASVTSMIKVFEFPTGGSITLASTFFATLPGFFFGPAVGITALRLRLSASPVSLRARSSDTRRATLPRVSDAGFSLFFPAGSSLANMPGRDGTRQLIPQCTISFTLRVRQ